MKLTDSIILYAKTNTGNRFKQWGDGNTTNPRQLLVGDAIGMKAIFEPEPPTPPTPSIYTIGTGVNPAGSGIVSGGGNYEEGTSATLTASANSGYHFVRWTKNDVEVSTNSTYTFTVSETATYVAVFDADTPTQYTLTLDIEPQDSGTVTGGGTYNAGTKVTIKATPNTGYEFVQWSDGNKNAERQVKVTTDMTLTAVFKSSVTSKVTITTSVDPDGSGTVTGGGEYNIGEEVTLEATAKTGYKFSQWSDGTSTNPLKIIASADASYEASFELMEKRNIQIDVNPQNKGSVTGNGTGEHFDGEILTLEATPVSGYKFVGWYNSKKELISKNNPYEYTVSGDAILTATFEEGTSPIVPTVE